MSRPICALAAVVLAVGPAHAQDPPRSAIPWLTDLMAPAVVAPQPSIESDPNAPITVIALNDRMRDGLGLLPPSVTGFPRDLWSGTSALKARTLVETTPYAGVPSLRALLRTVLIADVVPPTGSSATASLLLARIDRLLAIGALNEAAALIDTAEPDIEPLFRRWFDVALLQQEADAACAALERSPMLSPAKGVQVFCLARRGEWDAAAVALTLAESLGQIGEADSQLLAFFLDPALIEEEAPPEPGNPISTLEFLIRESVGLPRPEGRLPNAFLHADLANFIPVRFRMVAGERLVRAGALPESVLFSAYREEPAAASGGVWDRSTAVQSFDAATDGQSLADGLRGLDEAMAPAGLRYAAAKEYAALLRQLRPEDIPGPVHRLIAGYQLIAGASDVSNWLTHPVPRALRAASFIALGDGQLPRDMDPRTYAIVAPFLEPDPTRLFDDAMAALGVTDRYGETLMAAIALLASDDFADPDDISLGLAALRALGLDAPARRIAVELLLLDEDLADG